MSAMLRLFRLALGIAVLALPVAAGAEALRDPTRPAFDVDAGRDGLSGSAGAADAGAATAGAAPTGPRLQSILTRADGSALAVIDGRTLAIGDRFGRSRLVAIGSGRVTLRGPEGSRVLRLTPAADKKPRRATGPDEQTRKPEAPKKPKSPAAAQPGRKTP
jgi:hypothetical protein